AFGADRTALLARRNRLALPSSARDPRVRHESDRARRVRRAARSRRRRANSRREPSAGDRVLLPAGAPAGGLAVRAQTVEAPESPCTRGAVQQAGRSFFT